MTTADQPSINYVYLLYHERPSHLPDEDGDWKLFGVYSTAGLAEAARERARDRPGFRDYPAGFLISKMVLDRDEWTSGFVTVEHE